MKKIRKIRILDLWPVLSAESTSVESAAKLVPEEVQSDVSTQMNTLTDY